MTEKSLKITLQFILLSVIAIIPFVKIRALYFPFVSGKVYLFRTLVIAAFFFWTWLMLKQKPKNIFNNILVVSAILFLLAQIFVSFFAVSPALAFFSSIERQDGVIQYGFWMMYFLMLVSAFKTQKDWKIFFSVFIAAAFAICCYGWFNSASQDRLSGIFGNPSYLAAYLIFAIGFCLVVFERKFFNGWIQNAPILLSAVFFAITLIYTQTRGAYLGVGLAVFLFCLLSVLFLRKQNKKLAIYCAVILASGIILVSGIFLAKDTAFIKSHWLFSRITEVTSFWEVGSIRERILNWQITLKAFAEKPLFGYGPENFMLASNKYYDFRIGKGEPWFDRAHNQPLEILATGGIVLFAFYLFFTASAFYVIFKISKSKKMLAFILSGIFTAYIVQGLFLFDTLPIYLGLFPFFAFLVFLCRSDYPQNGAKESALTGKSKGILVLSGILCIFLLSATVLKPYTANAAALNFLAYSSQGYLKESELYAKKALAVKSSYTFWELRKRMGWQLLSLLDQEVEFADEQKKYTTEIYDIVVPELEKFAKERPFDPQIYYVLPRVYRLGYKKLEKNDLGKAEELIKKAFNYSDSRVEYYNEAAQILLDQGKFDEAEKLVKEYADKTGKETYYEYFSPWFLGNFYFVAQKYDLAIENYKKAEEAGYAFYDNEAEYSRYLLSADKSKKYQDIINMATKRLQFFPDADTYFNVALSYFYLEQKDQAKSYFQKALELNKDQYQQYAHFFGL
jgi:O-antigen ligase/Tfp pilus assembly protein PilF